MLPDYLTYGLRVVFCGTAASNRSAAVGHYYAGPGNAFWSLLAESAIVPILLTPPHDAEVLRFGVGLTDLAKNRSASRDSDLSSGDFDLAALEDKVSRFRPGMLVFTGKTSAQVVSRRLGCGGVVRLGRQEWTVAGVTVFVVPSPSAANRGTAHLEGKESRLAWFQALALSL